MLSLTLSLSLSVSLLKGTKNTACTQAKPVKRRTAGKNMIVITVYDLTCHCCHSNSDSKCKLFQSII